MKILFNLIALVLSIILALYGITKGVLGLVLLGWLTALVFVVKFLIELDIIFTDRENTDEG